MEFKVIVALDERTISLVERLISTLQGKPALAEVVAAPEETKAAAEPKPVAEPKPTKKAKAAPAPEPTEAPEIEAPEEKAADPKQKTKKSSVTIEDLRALVAEKKRAGHGEALVALLKDHNATKLSEISPDEYEAVAAAVKAL